MNQETQINNLGALWQVLSSRGQQDGVSSSSSSSIPWQKALLALAVAYYTSLAIYRLYFHPLSRFPGPKIAALTRYYEGYYDVICGGRYTWKIAELHNKYGPIIRISPHEVHVSDPAFFEKLYNQTGGRWDKHPWQYNAFGLPDGLVTTVDHGVHKARRAALNSFFSRSHVVRRHDIVWNKTERLCGRMRDWARSGVKDTKGMKGKESFKLGAAVSAFTRDASLEFLLGMSAADDLGKDDFNASFTSFFQRTGFIWHISKFVPWFTPALQSLPPWVMEKIANAQTKLFFKHRETIGDAVQELMSSNTRKSSDSNVSEKERPRTLVDDILASNHLPPREKTFGRITEEAHTITGGAFETTAHPIRVVLYNLYNGSDPSMLAKLRAELASRPDLVRSLSQPDQHQDLKWTDLEQLPYLTACIMEGLRLAPGLGTRLGRVAPDREIVYNDKYRIPPNTPIGMSLLLLHWDEGVYGPNARSFDPERWIRIGTEARNKARADNKTFAPFSRGTRNCIGMHFAWALMYISVATIVQRFDLELDGVGPEDVDPVSDQFLLGTERLDGFNAFVKERS